MPKFEDHIIPLRSLSPALMQAYLAGELSPRMQHEVEKYLLDHPFEAEAMEGYTENNTAFSELPALDDKLAERIIHKKEQHRKAVPLWRQFLPYAASFILILVATVAAVYFYGSAGSNNPISLNEPDIIQLDTLNPSPPKLLGAQNSPKSNAEQVDTAIHTEEEESQLALQLTEKKEVKDLPQERASTTTYQISAQKEEASPMSAKTSNEVSKITSLSKTPEMDTMDNNIEEIALQNDYDYQVESIAKSEGILTSKKKEKEAEKISIRGVSSYQNKRQADIKVGNIEGKVIDAENGEGLPGVNIIIQNTNLGANTDVDGYFNIDAQVGDILVVNFIGMTSTVVNITDTTFLEIALSTDVRQLSEVVISSSGSEESVPDTYQSAKPIGGMKAYKQYLETALVYPMSALEKRLEGKVKLKATIKASGEIGEIEVVKSLSKACDAEAIRLIKTGPSWEAAEKKGEPIESTLSIKVKFKLNH